MRAESNCPEDTERVGYLVGRRLKAGDVVALYGDLGSGKTTFVKGVAKAFGIAERDVTSASFTIIAEYGTSPPFFHIDLYRVAGKEDVDNTGIWDCIGGGSVCVIEWADRIGDEQATDFIKVRIEGTGNDRREIWVEGLDEEDRNNL